MSERNKFACYLYQDQFERLNETFDDATLGRILRAAFTFGFTGELVELSEPIEKYACRELTDSFARNRESYEQKSVDGSINAAIKYAKNEEDLKNRLAGIEGITSFQQFEAVKRFREKRK